MEALFTKWMGMYREKMLPKGEYMGALYDLGFDTPVSHTIRRENNMYSFYAREFNGKLELRGLDNQSYRVTDYVSGKDFGGPDPAKRIRLLGSFAILSFVARSAIKACPGISRGKRRLWL
jgi:alpha-galactosidase